MFIKKSLRWTYIRHIVPVATSGLVCISGCAMFSFWSDVGPYDAPVYQFKRKRYFFLEERSRESQFLKFQNLNLSLYL